MTMSDEEEDDEEEDEDSEDSSRRFFCTVMTKLELELELLLEELEQSTGLGLVGLHSGFLWW
jgi:hypothetical protein